MEQAHRARLSEHDVTLGANRLPMAFSFDYDVRRWDLRAIVRDYFGTDALETLHEDPRWNPPDPVHAPPNTATLQNSWDVSKALRAAVIDRVMPVLDSLIHHRIADFVERIVSHQPQAMMRVNFHGSRAILRFHTDREYGQRDRALNIWLPVTRVYGSNSLYFESAPGLSDFKPVVLDYGQALLFYGTELQHGTLDNMSGGTRISLDFRVSV
ncbi:StrG-like protein [Sphingomonas elodea]|uniref:StrG-like protein n=1 Tax=Sphingomonas elodea TaxID=179878 RepID=UPI00026303DF|nr:StrG-like protein [Sphingomonas elodea]